MKEKVKGLFKRLRQARGPKKPRKMSPAAYRSSRTHFVPGAYYCGSPAE